jgi:large subunit ribosomal protein L23
MQEKSRTLCFRVSVASNKIEIKRAIEKLFSVKVADIRTVKVAGKLKRRGQHSGYAATWKKAYITLKAGEKMIEYFEGT